MKRENQEKEVVMLNQYRVNIIAFSVLSSYHSFTLSDKLRTNQISEAKDNKKTFYPYFIIKMMIIVSRTIILMDYSIPKESSKVNGL